MIELQGHAIKNKDLLAASGAITLKGADSLDELQEDEQAVGRGSDTTLQPTSTSTILPFSILSPLALPLTCLLFSL